MKGKGKEEEVDPFDENLARAVEVILKCRGGVALTGAGISVDSGIPDFRSRGGLWERFDPMEYATISAFQKNPEKVWKMLEEMDALLARAEPNAGHTALAEMERMGYLTGIITQNIDSLHSRAGSRVVVEFHGSGRTLSCLKCRRGVDAEEYRKGGGILPPRCEGCGSVMKPDVVFFGEPIPEKALTASHRLIRDCRFLLVVGTSAEVAPASLIPYEVISKGVPLMEVNLSPTHLSLHPSTISLQGSSTTILPEMVKRLQERGEE